MSWEASNDFDALREFCRRDPARYIFHLGDLDPVEREHCHWFVKREGSAPREVALDYHGLSIPCLQLLGTRGPLGADLAALLPLCPAAGYAFIDPGDLPRVAEARPTRLLGTFHRMLWEGFPAGFAPPRNPDVRKLGEDDLGEIVDLLERAYPGSYFEPGQLLKGVYFGVGRPGRVVACAGVHVFSEREQVAVLGNIATLPRQRGRGHAQAATAALIEYLAPRARWLGLNVEVGNVPALRVYRKLGFREMLRYEAVFMEAAASESR